MLQTLVSMERWKRDDFLEEMYQWLVILQNALLCRNTPQQARITYPSATEATIINGAIRASAHPAGIANPVNAAHLVGAAHIIGSARSSSEILAAIQQLQKAIQYTQGNISVADICGHLQWSLR